MDIVSRVVCYKFVFLNYHLFHLARLGLDKFYKYSLTQNGSKETTPNLVKRKTLKRENTDKPHGWSLGQMQITDFLPPQMSECLASECIVHVPHPPLGKVSRSLWEKSFLIN